MGRKRTGSVYEKPAGSGQWWYAFLLRSGKRWAKPVPARPDASPITETDARAYKDEVLRRYDTGAWDPEAPAAPEPPPEPTFGEYATRWAAKLAHSSAHAERRIVAQHIAPTELGRMKITEVTGRAIAAWVMEVRAKPAPKGGTLAPMTVRGIYQVVHKALVAAVFEELIPSNPCALPRGILPKGGDKVPGARRSWRYERHEVVEFISAVEIPVERRMLYGILFLAGLRCGESIVLRWQDWDRARRPLGCLTVSRGLNNKARTVKDTKTGAVREIPVHPTLAAMLAEWRLGGWERHYGRAPTEEDLIVPSRTLRMRNGRNVYGQLAHDARSVGVRPRRVHGARHTFISMLIDDGARPDLIARLTHTRPVKTAFDVYRSEAWSTMCAEVLRLKIERRGDVLPLWRAVGAEQLENGEGSATESATASMNTDENHLKASAPEIVTRTSSLRGYARDSRENHGVSSGVGNGGGPIPGSDGPSGSDSATAGSDSPALGPLTGEALAYLWVEQILARGEEP